MISFTNLAMVTHASVAVLNELQSILSQTNSTLCQVSTCSEPCIACLVNYPILGNNTLSNFISFPRESKTFKFSIDLF